MRKHDLTGAYEAGIDCVGVLYGYGSYEELSAYRHVFIAKNVCELREFLLAEET